MYDVVSILVKSVPYPRQRLSKYRFSQPVFTRQTSTSTEHFFPFPPRTNPTPHEIFHLPRGASQNEIKTRYYELVKVYHPDATHCQHDVSSSVRNARFRAITHAYGVLRGRNGLRSSAGAWDYRETRDEAMRAELRRRSRRSRSAPPTTTAENIDDTQLWYTLTAFGLVGIIAALGSISSHMDRVERHTQSAAANLAQARADARANGMERRRKIRERVRSFHEGREMVDGSGHPKMRDTSNVWQGGLVRGETGPENVLNHERM